MKEEIYGDKKALSILDKGQYNGIMWVIVSYGTHPCSYICIGDWNKLYGKKEEDLELDLDVHGGVTYTNNDLWFNPESISDQWWFGWDYSHFNDYNSSCRIEGKKWTLDELKKDVLKVCKKVHKYSKI